MVTRGSKLRETTDPVARNETILSKPAAKDDTVAKSEPLSQRKRQEAGRYLLQVDRQTKSSYPTPESAEAAGMAIKKGHPIVQVSVYDSIDCVNKLVELPAAS